MDAKAPAGIAARKSIGIDEAGLEGHLDRKSLDCIFAETGMAHRHSRLVLYLQPWRQIPRVMFKAVVDEDTVRTRI